MRSVDTPSAHTLDSLGHTLPQFNAESPDGDITSPKAATGSPLLHQADDAATEKWCPVVNIEDEFERFLENHGVM